MKTRSTSNYQLPTSKKLRIVLGVGGWKLGVLVATLFFALGVAPVFAQRPGLSTQQILEQLERDWIDALKRNDADFVDTILAPEFVSTFADGTRGDRAHELQEVKAFNQQVDEWAVGEFTVKVFNDAAVVWFTQRMVGPVQGVSTEIVTRYMDVFINRDGKWLCVGSQSTKVTAK